VANKKTLARRAALAQAAADLRAQLDAEAAETPPEASTAPVTAPTGIVPEEPVNWFRGDAHALLRQIYTDPRMPLELRVDAAKSAIRFERPALVASHVQHSNAPSRQVLANLSTAQLRALLADMDQAGTNGQVIDVAALPEPEPVEPDGDGC
jgi:hypothetical protein